MMIRTRAPKTEVTKRVMLADDHPIVRKGLRVMIEGMPGWEVCAEASDGIEAVAVAEDARPDVVIMDFSMPGLCGIDAILTLRRVVPKAKILVLTMHESDHRAGEALQAGARGYVLKREGEDKLKEGLAALCSRQDFFCPSVPDDQLERYRNPELGQREGQLTPREKQIVKMIAEGNSNRAIASALDLSIKTVETHRGKAMHRIGVKGIAELTLYAARNGLTQL